MDLHHEVLDRPEPPAGRDARDDRTQVDHGWPLRAGNRSAANAPRPARTFEGLGLGGLQRRARKSSPSSGRAACAARFRAAWSSCDSSGKRFECVKEETCPLTAQKVKGRDEFVIESNDRIVANFYKTINDREVKVGEMVSVRQK